MHSLKLIVKCCIGLIFGSILGVMLGHCIVSLPFVPSYFVDKKSSVGMYTGALCAIVFACLIYKDYFRKLAENEPDPADSETQSVSGINTKL